MLNYSHVQLSPGTSDGGFQYNVWLYFQIKPSAQDIRYGAAQQPRVSPVFWSDCSMWSRTEQNTESQPQSEGGRHFRAPSNLSIWGAPAAPATLRETNSALPSGCSPHLFYFCAKSSHYWAFTAKQSCALKPTAKISIKTQVRAPVELGKVTEHLPSPYSCESSSKRFSAHGLQEKGTKEERLTKEKRAGHISDSLISLHIKIWFVEVLETVSWKKSS